MKKYLICIALLSASASRAAEPNEIEKAYIWTNVATTIAITFCNARGIKDGVLKMGDRNGIDVNAYARAIIAAASAANGSSYNRSDLIPGVTQIYRLAQRTILDDLQQDKSKTCDNWLAILRSAGTVE